MRILSVLTYYRPHTSGLTIYAERLARALVRRGHQVTVMTTQYDKSLPCEEIMDGVRVIRVPVALRISKGVLAPTFGFVATKLVSQHDVVQMHLPQFDAPGIALRARLFRRPSVLTYHCDLHLPPGIFNRLVNLVVKFQNNMAGLLSDLIVTYTQDYADHSSYLSRYKHKLHPILPPVALPPPERGAIASFAEQHQITERRPVIGMVTRFAAEKGVEILLEALPVVLEKYPKAQVLFAGQFQNVLGERVYHDRLMPFIRKFESTKHWIFLGNLDPLQLSAYYPNIDILVVPSLNSTEAFGLVQIEAMINNVPCIASDLPGVRQPVIMTGMGKIVPIGDAEALAQAILDILVEPKKYLRNPAEITRPFDPDTTAAEYEKLFEWLMKGK